MFGPLVKETESEERTALHFNSTPEPILMEIAARDLIQVVYPFLVAPPDEVAQSRSVPVDRRFCELVSSIREVQTERFFRRDWFECHGWFQRNRVPAVAHPDAVLRWNLLQHTSCWNLAAPVDLLAIIARQCGDYRSNGHSFAFIRWPTNRVGLTGIRVRPNWWRERNQSPIDTAFSFSFRKQVMLTAVYSTRRLSPLLHPH